MTIGQYYTLSVNCNLCGKISTPVRHDRGYYQQVGQEEYTERMNAKAVRLALDEGFIIIERLIPNAAMPGGFQHNDQHVCPACQGEIVFHRQKGHNTVSKDIAKLRKAKRNKKMM